MPHNQLHAVTAGQWKIIEKIMHTCIVIDAAVSRVNQVRPQSKEPLLDHKWMAASEDLG